MVDPISALAISDDTRRHGVPGETVLTLFFIRFLEIKHHSNYLEKIKLVDGEEILLKEIINELENKVDWGFESILTKSVKDLRILEDKVLNGIIENIRFYKSAEDIALAFSFLLKSYFNLYRDSPLLNGILAEILDVQSGKLFAPSFGLGEILRRFKDKKGELAFYGNEPNFLAFGLARMNLMINEIDGNFKLEDCFKTNPDEFTGIYDYTVIVPPFSLRHASRSLNPEFAKKYGSHLIGDATWPKVALDSLKINGKGVVVLPIVSAFSNRADLKEMRRTLISSGFLESVIVLPGGMLEYTSVSTAIYVLNKSSKNKDLQFIDGRNGIIGSSTTSTPKSLKERLANEIVNAYRLGRGRDIDSKRVPIEEIQACDYNLDPKTYILNLEENESRKESIKESIEQIDRELREQTDLIEKSDNPEEILQSEVRISRLGTVKESMTMELVEIEGKRAKIDRDNEEHKTSQALKVKAFKMVIIVMSVEIALTYAIFGLVGLKILEFTEVSLNIFVGATISQITAIFYWIIKHLFPSSSN